MATQVSKYPNQTKDQCIDRDHRLTRAQPDRALHHDHFTGIFRSEQIHQAAS